MSADETSLPTTPSETDEGGASAPETGPQDSVETISFEEAMAQARADLGLSDDDGDAPTTGSPEEGQPEGEAPAPETPERTEPTGESEGDSSAEATQRQPSDPTQAELERIRTMIGQGRIAEFTARQRGIYNAIKDQISRDADLEKAVVDEALRLRQLRLDDPDAFLTWREQNPSQAKAYDDFWSMPQHQSLTAENRRPQPTERQIRAQVQSEWESVVQETARDIATRHGLSGEEFDRLAGEHKTNYGSLLEASFEAAVTKAVNTKLETERTRIAAEEREAAIHELEAQYAGRTSVRLPAGGTTGKPGGGEPQKASSMEEAVEMTLREFESRQFSNAR